MEMLRRHEWTQNLFIGPARLPGLPYVTEVQQHVCRTCGEIINLPDCRKKTCLILMSLGCKGEKPKVKWQAPMPEPKTKEDAEKRDYPAKRNGHEAKKRRK